MAPPRFTTEISLGHLAIIASLLGPVILFYADVTKTLGNHETRLSAIEKIVENGGKDNTAFQNEMRSLILTVREDIAGIKATLKTGGGR